MKVEETTPPNPERTFSLELTESELHLLAALLGQTHIFHDGELSTDEMYQRMKVHIGSAWDNKYTVAHSNDSIQIFRRAK